MAFLLSTLADGDPKRRTVVVPSYTCYSVAASAIRAGLDVLACDIDESTLSYDRELLESIDFDRVLAVVSANLYGIPDDLRYLERLAAEEGVLLIDDAAQSFGATVGGRSVGSFGSAGILSLDKGKNITSMNGGIIISRDGDLCARIEKRYASLRGTPRLAQGAELLKAAAYWFLLRPGLYWLPRKLPFLGLGKTVYDAEFPIRGYGKSLAPLAVAQLERLDDLNHHRVATAVRYLKQLPKHPDLRTIEPAPGAEAVYLRFPLRILRARARKRMLDACGHLGCTASYPTSIAEIPAVGPRLRVQNERYDRGMATAREIVTLPTHSFVTASDVSRICESIHLALEDASPS